MVNTIEKEKEQHKIKEWFNTTYRYRGTMYLRPIRAYRIFPVLLDVQPNKKLLDVACGLGRMLQASEEYPIELSGFDISDVAVGKAKANVPSAQIQVANAEAMPYADNTFDYLTCLGSLERMIDLNKVLSEVRRVVKPGGKILFLVRNINGWTWKISKDLFRMKVKASHQGAKSFDDWSSTFKSAGFKIKEVLPDQYPIKKRERITSLGLKRMDYKKISKTWLPLEYVHEYIFVLEN